MAEFKSMLTPQDGMGDWLYVLALTPSVNSV